MLKNQLKDECLLDLQNRQHVFFTLSFALLFSVLLFGRNYFLPHYLKSSFSQTQASFEMPIVPFKEGLKPQSEVSRLVFKGKINLNSATLSDLDALPGIGPKIAERIIAYRKQKCSFKNINELK